MMNNAPQTGDADTAAASTGVRYLRRLVRGRAYRLLGARQEGAVDLMRLVPGFLTAQEGRTLYRVARTGPGSGSIAEIGSWKGRSTVALSLGLRDRGEQGAKLYAIDPHEGSAEHRDQIAREGRSYGAFLRNLRRYGALERVEPLLSTSLEAAEEFAAGGMRFRFVFIDGAHDEDSVRADIRAFLPLLEPGGLMALHDHSAPWPGVLAAYSAELEGRSEFLEQTDDLLLVRPRSAPSAQ